MQYSSEQKKGFARYLRSNPTLSEDVLWRLLRKNKLGVAFRRQKLIFGWIADFYCPSAKLVVEVDGSSHIGREASDSYRDRVLAINRIETLRIPAALVFENLNHVRALISAAVERRLARSRRERLA